MIAPLLGLAITQLADTVDPHRLYAANEEEAVLMLDPVTVCDGQVASYAWSADGSGLVAHRQVVDSTPSQIADAVVPPQGRGAETRVAHHDELVRWDLRTGRPQTVVGAMGRNATVTDLAPMPGTDRILVSAKESLTSPAGAPREVQTAAMISVRTGVLTRLSAEEVEEGSSFSGFVPSPSQPLVALVWDGTADRRATVRYVGPSGRLGPAVAVPLRSYPSFDDRGLPGLTSISQAEGRTVRRFQSLDPTTGKLGAIRALPPPTPPKDEASPLWTTESGRSTMAPTVRLALRGGKPEESGILTTDGYNAQVSPKFDAVAYVGQGALRIRRLVHVPRDAYDKALIEAAKREALNKAKQVGLGLLMYAADHDDVLPGQDADLRRQIGPYLKNDRLFDGFGYTFHGGNLLTIEEIATTELGSVPGPGGRAVVYTDGHAKWIPDGS